MKGSGEWSEGEWRGGVRVSGGGSEGEWRGE